MGKFSKISKLVTLICALSAFCNQSSTLSYENMTKADNENLVGDEEELVQKIDGKCDNKVVNNEDVKFKKNNNKSRVKKCKKKKKRTVKDGQKNSLEAQSSNDKEAEIENKDSETVKKSVEIVFVIDKSGSMGNLREAMINNFNQMLKEHKKLEAEFNVYVTTVLFSDDSRKVHNHQKVSDISDMTEEDYNPFGGTALLDTLGNTINEISCNEEISKLNGDNNHKVIFVIMTDGEENSSRLFKIGNIKSMIEDKQKLGWTFMFFGANIDSFAEAGGIGIDREYVHDFVASEKGVAKAMNACRRKVGCCLKRA